MSLRMIRPRGRGFLLLDSHPAGAAQVVRNLVAEADDSSIRQGQRDPLDRPVVLVIGSSAGYGLAATIASIVGHGFSGIGLCFERPANDRLSATAGWYRTAELAHVAKERGVEFDFVNADCFLDDTKRDVLDRIQSRFGRVDYLVYSVAAPRRTDPTTGIAYQSVIKSLSRSSETNTLAFDDAGVASLKLVAVPAATEQERLATVKVMGGEDWALWVQALAERDLLAPGFKTVALSYIGSELNSAVYRDGTIGSAKEDLEATAGILTGSVLRQCGGQAMTSVNGAAVTQASTAIPGVPLYVALLRDVLGERMHSPMRQSLRLWEQLAGHDAAPVDGQGRIRLDDWELDPSVQEEVTARWHALDDASADTEVPHASWVHDEVMKLYGFAVAGVDYAAEVEVDVAWPG